MQIIIDIPKNVYYDTFQYVESLASSDFELLMMKAVKNGTPLPKDATNGDVVNLMFPKAKEIHFDVQEYVRLWFDDGHYYSEYATDWWNAPYKKEVGEQ